MDREEFKQYVESIYEEGWTDATMDLEHFTFQFKNNEPFQFAYDAGYEDAKESMR